MRQLSLFESGNPTWEDVQKGYAAHVPHAKWSRPCTDACMWHGSRHEAGGAERCYLFADEVRDGMCPSTGHLEWR